MHTRICIGHSAHARRAWMFIISVILFLYMTTCTQEGNNNPFAPIENSFLQFGGMAVDREYVRTGGDRAVVQATVMDALNNRASGKTVSFSTVLGVITETAVTDTGGVAEAEYRSGSTSGVDTIIASIERPRGGTVYDTTYITVQGTVILTLSADSPINANGESTSKISVSIRTPANNPVAGVEVGFSASMGTIPASAVTDQNGLASVSLLSERRNGVALVTAAYESNVDSIEVLFSGVTINASISPNNLFADGATWAALSAEVKDAAGRAIQGENVTVSSLLSSFRRGSGRTNAAGIYSDSVRSSQAGTDSIRVMAAGAEGAAVITYTGYRLEMTATPQAFTAQLESSTIRVRLLDNEDSPVSGAAVGFATTIGEFTAEDSATDAGGTAEAVFSSFSIGEAEITAEVAVAGFTIRKSIKVTVRAAAASDVTLLASPRVVNVNGGEASLTATVTDAKGNPVPDVTVNYRVLSGPRGVTVNPSVSQTNENGIAATKFISGAISSDSTNDVRIQARIQGTQIVSNSVELTVAGVPKSIIVGSGSSVQENGTFRLDVSAIVSDLNGNPVVDGTEVSFATKPPIGIITSPAATASGIAKTSLIYPVQRAGEQVTILVETAGLLDSLVINELPGLPGVAANVGFRGFSQNDVLANGINQVTLSFAVYDVNSSGLEKVVRIVMRYLDKEVIVTSNTIRELDAQGVPTGRILDAQASFSLADSIDRYPIFTATSEDKSITINDDSVFAFRGVQMELSAENSTVNKNSQAAVTLLLKEKTSGIAIPNAAVRFGASKGTIINTASTDNQGRVSVSWSTGASTGLATITATYGATLQKSMTINVVEEVPSQPHSIELTSSETAIQVRGSGGKQTATISGAVTDAAGLSVSDNTPIVFTTSTGTFPNALAKDTAYTSGGDASLLLTSGTVSGPVIITAKDIQSLISESKKLLTVYGIPTTLSVAPNTGDVTSPQSGFLSFPVLVLVTGSQGNPVIDGTTVSFELRTSDPGQITASAATEDGFAEASLTYSSNDAGDTVRVTVESGALSQSVDVRLPLEDSPAPTTPDTVMIYAGTANFTENDPAGSGLRSIQVSAMVRTMSGIAVNNGTQVEFKVSSGNPGVFSATYATTSNGVATSKLIYAPSDATKTVTIVCTAGSKTQQKAIVLQ